jgi:hypothetical protein
VNKHSTLIAIAENAAADFAGLSFVTRRPIDKKSVSKTRTNGVSIDCGDLTRGKKSFTFSVWLDQLVRCHGDHKGQEYFWYGTIASSSGALRDLVEVLPVKFKPAPISYRKGAANITSLDLKKVKKARKGTFRQFKDELPKSYLGKIIEEQYPQGCFLGRFERCASPSGASNRKLSKRI